MVMREVSPASYQGLTADEYFELADPLTQAFATRVRASKAAGARSFPSSKLILEGQAPQPDWRPGLLDKIASLVDEDLLGRSDMCKPFAYLLAEALKMMGVKAKAMVGQAQYQRSDGTWAVWQHAWVKIGADILVDGNIDSMAENPTLQLAPPPAPSAYWGPRKLRPRDRRIDAGRPLQLNDLNVHAINTYWLPDLIAWLRGEGLVAQE